MFCCLIELLGVIALLNVLYQVAFFVYSHYICTKFEAEKYGGKNGGGWALITGASDGIGRGFAEELACCGFNVILVSRTESKLKELSEELKSKYNVQAKHIALDVSSKEIEPMLNKVKEVLETVSLRILVNNVGTNTSIPVEFTEMTDAEIDCQLQVNVVFTTKLTKLCIPYLTKSKNSGIINLSSISCLFSSAPFMSVYAATKAYDDNFSRSLTTELKRFGCDVLSITPSFVTSQMSGFKRTSNFVTSPIKTAKDTLPKLGKFSELTPFWSHDLLRIFSAFIPTPLTNYLYFKEMKKTRERLLRKKS